VHADQHSSGFVSVKCTAMGISSSPAIFQEFMDKLTQDVPMEGAFLDDCLCSGKDDKKHLSTLRRILQRMRESNYRLRKDKCQFMEPSVDFIGFVLSKEGIHTSPSKANCIMSIQRPNNAKELSSFLGLVNFYRSFISRFAGICELLYRLTQTEVTWKWTKKCQCAEHSMRLSELSHHRRSWLILTRHCRSESAVMRPQSD